MVITKKVCCYSLFLAVFLTLTGATAFASTDYQLRETLTYSDVTGDSSSSFLKPGLVLTQDFSIRAMGTMDSGWRYRANLSLRNIIDFSTGNYGRIDFRSYRLTLTKGSINCNLGRVYAELGQYLMTQSLTGAVLTDRDMELSLGAGVSRPYVQGRNLERLAMGALKGFEFNNPLSREPDMDKIIVDLGIAYVIDSPNPSELINPEESRVLSTTIKIPLSSTTEVGLFIAGSNYDKDTSDDVPGVTGSALKAELVYQLPGLRWQSGMERVSPDFKNLASPMSVDRIEVYTRARMSLTEVLRLDTSYRNYRDNLEKNNPATTTNQLFSLMFNQSWLSNRNRELIYGFKGRLVSADDNSVNTQNLTAEAQFRDRVGELDYRLDISNNWVNNVLNPAANRTRLAGGIDLKISSYLMDMPVDPFFNVRIEQEVPSSGGSEITYTANLGSNLRIDYDNSLNARVRYMFLDRPGSADDLTKVTTGLTYIRELLMQNSTLELSAEAVETSYADTTKNYQELVVTAVYSRKF